MRPLKAINSTVNSWISCRGIEWEFSKDQHLPTDGCRNGMQPEPAILMMRDRRTLMPGTARMPKLQGFQGFSAGSGTHWAQFQNPNIL